MTRSSALLLLGLMAVGFGIAVMLARFAPASQERTWWRAALDTTFARDAVATAGTGDERPPIIVRGPSIYFDGGDRLNPSPKWHGWTEVSSSGGTVVWAPDQGAGAPVRAFEVLALNAISTPTCPLGPVLAERIDLVYAGTARPQTASIHTVVDSNNRPVPAVETTLRLTLIPGNVSAPDALGYSADGVLTGFNAVYQGRAAAVCTFNAQGGAYLRIAPVR